MRGELKLQGASTMTSIPEVDPFMEDARKMYHYGTELSIADFYTREKLSSEVKIGQSAACDI